MTGDVPSAAEALREALTLSRDIRNRSGEASPWDRAHGLAGLGRCAIARGRHRDGMSELRDALDIFRRIDAADASDVAAELAAFELSTGESERSIT